MTDRRMVEVERDRNRLLFKLELELNMPDPTPPAPFDQRPIDYGLNWPRYDGPDWTTPVDTAILLRQREYGRYCREQARIRRAA